MSMPHKQASKPKMEIGISITIIIPDLAALRAADEKWIRWHSLERTGNAHRQRQLCALVHLTRARRTFSKLSLLAPNNLLYNPGIDRNWFSQHKNSFSINIRKLCWQQLSITILNCNSWI